MFSSAGFLHILDFLLMSGPTKQKRAQGTESTEIHVPLSIQEGYHLLEQAAWSRVKGYIQRKDRLAESNLKDSCSLVNKLYLNHTDSC